MTSLARVLLPGTLILSVVCSAWPAAGADDGGGILRFDPLAEKPEELIEVPKKEVKRGCIYSHYSRRLDRRVWSFVQADGEFWYAFGPGTTQAARRFDMRTTRREGLEKLEEIEPDLASALKRTDRPGYLRLNADGQWDPARDDVTHGSIYNAETGQRWEQVCHMEHEARIEDPGKYDKDKTRRENDKFGDGVHAIWGVLPNKKTELQAVRFDAGKFSKERAEKWLEDHHMSPPEEPKTKLERHCEYIPVKTITGGNRWVVRYGRYVPAGATQW